MNHPIRGLFRLERIRGGDRVDDGDVLALFQPLVIVAAHARALGVAARVVAQKVVDRPDAEYLFE